MKKLLLAQGSDQWRAWRRDGIGGSDIAAIVGVSPYADATRDSVLAAKVHGVEREANQAMRRGTNLEPHARRLYCHRAAVTHCPALCCEHDGMPWARVSLDGLPRFADGTETILELKCPGWQTHDLALAGIVPEHFAVQCQWQMLVCDLPACDFASFNPGFRFCPHGWPFPEKELLIARREGRAPHPRQWPADWLAVVRLDADAACQAWLLEEAAKFWFDVAEARAARAEQDRPAEARAF